MIKNKIVYFFLLISSIAFSQSDAFSVEKTKFQLGIGISKFISNVFPADKYAFLVESRVVMTSDMNYRFGLNYNFDTSEDGEYIMGAKIGLDKLFKKSKKWSFYYGADLGYIHNYLKLTKKHSAGILFSPFIGIMYRFSKNFSISTEPNVYFVQKIFIDKGTFDKNNKKQWVESGFGKIGYIQLNFHF